MQISGALNLEFWNFDLLYEQTVVQVVPEPSPTLIPGIFAAEFTPGDANSLSNITSGFTFLPGIVDEVFGLYPFLLNGVTGDGVLAYILFEFVPGQEGNDPNFRIIDNTLPQGAPEPNTLALFAAALLILTFMPRLRRLRERT